MKQPAQVQSDQMYIQIFQPEGANAPSLRLARVLVKHWHAIATPKPYVRSITLWAQSKGRICSSVYRSTIDDDGLAGHKRSLVAGQKDQRPE